MVDSISILADRIVPCFGDFNADGIIDLLIGTGEGGLKFFDRPENYPVGLIPSHKSESTTNFKVYPNPTSGLVTIETGDQSGGAIQIYDMQGRMVLDQMIVNQSNRIDLSHLQSGVF